MWWLLIGAFLYLLIRNQGDMQGVKKDARKIAKYLKKAIQSAAGAVRNAADEAKKQKAAAKAVPAMQAAEPAGEVRAESPEARENNALLKDLEENANIASMLAHVPVLNFPEDDPKYDSSRKYNYA